MVHQVLVNQRNGMLPLPTAVVTRSFEEKLGSHLHAADPLANDAILACTLVLRGQDTGKHGIACSSCR